MITSNSAELDVFAVADLRCEDLIDPIGIDISKPRFSWRMVSSKNGAVQTGYQILCATDTQLLKEGSADIWDSRKVTSGQSNFVPFAGKKITRGMPCKWTVRIWNEDGDASAWSKPAEWTYAGMATDKDWQAKWIYLARENAEVDSTSSPWIRKCFELKSTPGKCYIYVNVLGYFQLFINGERVGSDEFTPAVSQIDQRTFCVTYDVTEFLRKGNNSIGFWLGRGWSDTIPAHSLDSPMVRAQLEVVDPQGNSSCVITDESWRANPSSLTRTGKWRWGQYGGELQDAAQELPDWCKPDFDDSAWKEVALAKDSNSLVASEMLQRSRVVETIRPVSVKKLASGVWLVDMGKAMTGTFEICFPKGKRGHKVTMLFGDYFKSKSGSDPDELNTYNQSSEYLFRGSGEEVFRHRFNYASCRYIRIENVPEGELTADHITGNFITTALPGASGFSCSNETLNGIYKMMENTLRCLMLGGYQVDCHSRERFGYGGDGQASLDTTLSLLRADAFYRKWTQDWIDAQDAKTGGLPYTAPRDPCGGGPFWCGFLTAATLKHYQHYGDRMLLRRNYPAIKKWFELVQSKTVDNLQQKFCGAWYLGDWASPEGIDDKDEQSVHLFVNCYMTYVLEQAAQIADALDEQADAAAWRGSAEARRVATHEKFYNAETKNYANGYQADYIMPLMTGVVPVELKDELFGGFETDLLTKRKGHLGTGLSGTYMMIRYLQSIGRDDLIYTFTSKTTYPSWGYMLENGATATWEYWGGQYSRIHNCYNSIGSWFIEGLAGIRPDPKAPGFKNAIIKPAVLNELTFVNGTHDSGYGTIQSNWKRADDRVTMAVTIPANSTATVYVPAKAARDVTVNGRALTKADHVTFLRMEENRAVIDVASGRYEFMSLIATGIAEQKAEGDG